MTMAVKEINRFLEEALVRVCNGILLSHKRAGVLLLFHGCVIFHSVAVLTYLLTGGQLGCPYLEAMVHDAAMDSSLMHFCRSPRFIPRNKIAGTQSNCRWKLLKNL